MTRFQQVINAIPSFSKEELKQIQSRIDFFISSKSDPDTPLFDWLTEGFIYEARRRGLVGNVTKQLFNHIKPKDYLPRNEEVRSFLLSRASGSLNSQEELVLGRIVARALADWLSFRVPPNFGVLLRNISNCSQALEDSFPGYAEASMLGVLVRKYRKDTVNGT